MAKCKNCINLQNHWCDMVVDSPDENAERECCTYERMTNADKIRSMSDEELEEFIDKVNSTCIVNALGGDTLCDYGDVDCMECKDKFGGIHKWLQSEVEE